MVTCQLAVFVASLVRPGLFVFPPVPVASQAFKTSMKLTLTAVFAAVVALQSTNAAIDCNNWSTRYKKFIDGVCICNATATCDSFPTNYTTLTSSQAGLYRSSRDGERFRYELLTLASGSSSDADLTMDASTTYQTILGFGGAFTDAAAINLYKLSCRPRHWTRTTPPAALATRWDASRSRRPISRPASTRTMTRWVT